MAAIGHYVQVIMAIKVLEKASVVTYAVANTFKRVFVIVASIMYFQNTVSTMNAVGKEGMMNDEFELDEGEMGGWIVDDLCRYFDVDCRYRMVQPGEEKN